MHQNKTSMNKIDPNSAHGKYGCVPGSPTSPRAAHPAAARAGRTVTPRPAGGLGSRDRFRDRRVRRRSGGPRAPGPGGRRTAGAPAPALSAGPGEGPKAVRMHPMRMREDPRFMPVDDGYIQPVSRSGYQWQTVRPRPSSIVTKCPHASRIICMDTFSSDFFALAFLIPKGKCVPH